MTYSTRARKKVLQFRNNGHSLQQTFAEFGVAVSTIRRWEKLIDESGSLARKDYKRRPQLYREDELHSFIVRNPSASLREIADYFGGSITGAVKALKREKIIREKRK